jgi:hypothetical protein
MARLNPAMVNIFYVAMSAGAEMVRITGRAWSRRSGKLGTEIGDGPIFLGVADSPAHPGRLRRARNQMIQQPTYAKLRAW